MSHKIYSINSKSDYLVDITFFNGEVRQCDMKLLIETMDDSVNIDENLRRIEETYIERSKNGIVLPCGENIDSQILWGNSYAIDSEAINDVVVAFADTLIDTRERLKISQRELEKRSGVRQAEICKIENGEGNPSLKTMGRLFAAMNKELIFTDRSHSADRVSEFELDTVTESIARYLNLSKKQGFYTVDDMEMIPEGLFVELIDGFIYDMSVPNLKHQIFIKNIQKAFDKFIDDKGGACITLSGQTGLWFEDDDKDLLIPDMMVVCDQNKLQEKGIVGAPDFILEVLSPSTRARDLSIKKNKYKEKGVREYWLLDPKKEKLLVYDWHEGDDMPCIYGRNDVAPVMIYDGELTLNMAEIF